MFSSKLLQGSLLVQRSTIPPELFCNREVGTSMEIEFFIVCVWLCVCLPANTLQGNCVAIKWDHLLQFPHCSVIRARDNEYLEGKTPTAKELVKNRLEEVCNEIKKKKKAVHRF